MLHPFGLKFSRAQTNQQEVYLSVSVQFLLLWKTVHSLSDDGKELVFKDLKDWLSTQACYKSDAPIYSLKINGLANRACQILKRYLKVFNRNIGCSMGTYFDKVLFSHGNSSNARGKTEMKLLLGRSLRIPILDFCVVGEKAMYTLSVNLEPLELTYIIRKRRKTTWLLNNNRTIPASNGKFAPIPISVEFKTKPSPTNGKDVTKVPLSPVLTPSDDYHTVLTEVNLTKQKTTDRLKRNRTQTLKYQAAFVVMSSPTTKNNWNRLPRIWSAVCYRTLNTDITYIRQPNNNDVSDG